MNEIFTPKSISKVKIGKDEMGQDLLLELFSGSGGKVTLIGGNPGKGKSSLIKLLLTGLVNSNYSIIWFDAKSGADANPFNLAITGTISEGTIASLSNLTGTGNAYSISVTDSSVNAAALNTLDGKTTVAVNADSVGTLTGTAAAVKI